MTENIWYIIISETNEAIDFLCKGQKDKIVVEDVIRQIFSLMYYNPDTGELRMDAQTEHLCSVLKKRWPSAKKLTEEIYKILLYDYRFGNHTGNNMITGLDKILNSGESCSLDPLNRLAYDIWLPNLYSILLLEAKGHQIPETDAINLKELLLLKEYVGDYTKVYRTLGNKSLPSELKYLFAIKEKTGKEPYKICTRYPDLLLTMLLCLDSSPLCDKIGGSPVTAHSLKFNESFFNACMCIIAPEGNWTDESFIKYYLVERFLRINTKLNLFWGENREQFRSAKGNKALQNKSISALLADIFFSSPLVILQAETLADFIYNSEPIETDAELIEAQFLSFIINLSSCWIPIALILFRLYFLNIILRAIPQCTISCFLTKTSLLHSPKSIRLMSSSKAILRVVLIPDR